MSVTAKITENDKKMTMVLGERFDFSCHADFRNAYQSIDPTHYEITVDFKKTDYIDSAALGMLLVLRERAGGDHAKITLKSCQSSVQQILDITHFEDLFKFED